MQERTLLKIARAQSIGWGIIGYDYCLTYGPYCWITDKWEEDLWSRPHTYEAPHLLLLKKWAHAGYPMPYSHRHTVSPP